MGRFRTFTFAEVFRELEKQLKSPLLNQNETIWGIEEISNECKCSQKTIKNLIAQKKIPYHRFNGNGHPLFLKGEIINWLKNSNEINS